jgi:rubrerythrin
MNKPLGGRGKKAPYETQLVRVPVPVVQKVEQIVDEYRNLVINGEQSEFEKYPNLAACVTPVSYSEALQRAKEIVKTKRSAAESLAKLLQVLYGGTVSKEDLR